MSEPVFITKSQAVKLIAKRTCSKPNNLTDLRREKNNINGQIVSRIEKREIAQNGKEFLHFLDVSEYAKQKFPGKFDDWPSKPISSSIKGYGFATTFGAEAVWMPCTLVECHQHIKELTHAGLENLHIIRELQAEIESLKPYAEKWQSFLSTRNKGKKDRTDF